MSFLRCTQPPRSRTYVEALKDTGRYNSKLGCPVAHYDRHCARIIVARAYSGTKLGQQAEFDLRLHRQTYQVRSVHICRPLQLFASPVEIQKEAEVILPLQPAMVEVSGTTTTTICECFTDLGFLICLCD